MRLIESTRIAYNKGVCGKVWADKKTIIVPNVDEFPGHISCSSQSRSEIVVPILKNGKVRLVLDVDSDQLDTYNSEDQEYLEKIAAHIATLL